MSNNWGQNKPPIGSSINWSHPLSKGLVGCWLMNEGAGKTIKDITGNGSNGSFVGLTSWKNSKKGKLIDVNYDYGSNPSYINVVDKPSLSISGKISISALIKMTYFDNTSNLQTIIEKKYDGTNEGYAFRIDEGANTRLSISSYDGTSYATSYLALWNLGDLHHVVGLYNGVAWKLYIDGKLVSSTDKAKGAILCNGAVTIGASNINGTIGRYFVSQIGNINIWNRALSPSEIKDLYIAPYQFIYKPRRVFYSIPTGVTTWGHKIWGILNANIGKVNQVDKSNIEKVDRV